MENIQCIFCNKNCNRIVITENGYQGRKCSQCGLIFISPRPTFFEIMNLYRHDQSHIPAKSHISGVFGKKLQARHTLQLMKRLKRNSSILEIGAGAGYFLDEARNQGFEVYGIEFNSIQADFIRNNLNIPCEESPLGISSFNGKKFDIIYHCDVLSHFYDPIAAFQNIKDCLQENGIVVFETGNLGDVKEKYYRFFTGFQYPDHLFFFSENNLKELLRLTGFESVKIYRYSILLQLMISKILSKGTGLFKSEVKAKRIDKTSIATGVQPANTPHFNIGGFGFKYLIKIAYAYFFYFIRYKIGIIMPKKGSPQTVIVITRKR